MTAFYMQPWADMKDILNRSSHVPFGRGNGVNLDQAKWSRAALRHLPVFLLVFVITILANQRRLLQEEETGAQIGINKRHNEGVGAIPPSPIEWTGKDVEKAREILAPGKTAHVNHPEWLSTRDKEGVAVLVVPVQGVTKKAKGKGMKKKKSPKSGEKRRIHGETNVLAHNRTGNRTDDYLGEHFLQREIARSDLHHLYLGYHPYNPSKTPPEWNISHLGCKGAVCPDFRPCSKEGYEEITACHYPDFSDTTRVVLGPPENRPFEGLNVSREGGGGDNGTNGRRWHDPWVAEVFTLRNVYLNDKGQVFNETHYFDRGGVGSLSKSPEQHFRYSPTTTRVTVSPHLVHLANWNGAAFYHGLVDVLPLFLLLAPHMRGEAGGRAHVPITHRVGQQDFWEGGGSALLGLSVNQMGLRVLREDELYFAHRVIQPLYQWGSRPSRSLVHHLRTNHYIPPDGLPIFNPDWTIRVPAHPASPDHLIPSDWVVVLGKRVGSRRLEQSDEVEGVMVGRFGRERVMVFDGSLPVLQAKALFNRARLYVAVHGGGMSNMLFMPFRGSLLEITPREYPNACYHFLTEVCNLAYYSVVGEGDKGSSTNVDMGEMKRVLSDIAAKMEAQL